MYCLYRKKNLFDDCVFKKTNFKTGLEQNFWTSKRHEFRGVQVSPF